MLAMDKNERIRVKTLLMLSEEEFEHEYTAALSNLWNVLGKNDND